MIFLNDTSNPVFRMITLSLSSRPLPLSLYCSAFSFSQNDSIFSCNPFIAMEKPRKIDQTEKNRTFSITSFNGLPTLSSTSSENMNSFGTDVGSIADVDDDVAASMAFGRSFCLLVLSRAPVGQIGRTRKLLLQTICKFVTFQMRISDMKWHTQENIRMKKLKWFRKISGQNYANKIQIELIFFI